MIRPMIFVLATFFLFVGCSRENLTTPITHVLEKKETIYSLKQAKELKMKEVVAELEKYPVIFVGDHHNTKKTHKFFEKLLKELDKKGYRLNLANEWFTPKHDKLLKDFTDGKLDGIRLKERRHWDKFTKYKWEYVEPLYEAVKKNGGKLYGMNISKKDRKKISLKQFDKMSKKEKDFYDSLDLKVSAHKQLVAPFLKHCHQMPSKSKEPCEERMYRVQVAWDSYMAENVAKIAKEVIKTPKDKLLVFAGAMHIEYGVGIPLRFSRLNNLPFLIITNFKIDKEKEKVEIYNSKADIVYIYKN